MVENSYFGQHTMSRILKILAFDSICLCHNVIYKIGLIMNYEHLELCTTNDDMKYYNKPEKCDNARVSNHCVYRHFVKIHSLYSSNAFM